MPDMEWGTSVGFSGHYVQDTVGFEGILSAKDQPFGSFYFLLKILVLISDVFSGNGRRLSGFN